jgi:hypothetical protein
VVRETSNIVDPSTSTTWTTPGVSDGTGKIADSQIIVNDEKSLMDDEGRLDVSADTISTDVDDTLEEGGQAASADVTNGSEI